MALAALVRGDTCQAFLFNELAVNVAWAPLPMHINARLAVMVADAITGNADHNAVKDQVSLVLDRIHHGRMSDGTIVVNVPGTTAWQRMRNHFITSHATSSLIDLFSEDEGGQQEQLAIWLTDNLHPLSVHHAPKIPKGHNFRELTDVLISHEFGSVLIESKALAILTRDNLPGRSKLTQDVRGHIAKAANQLRGGIRLLRSGVRIVSKAGNPLDIERTAPPHAIILIPDLDLVEDRQAYDLEFIKGFMRATGGFLHLLDISELLRIVQAAEMIAARGKTTTPMMAFDYYLMQRAKKTAEANTLCIEVLLRFPDE